MSRPHFQPKSARREICRADGISLEVEVIASLHLTPGHFDDDRALVLAQLVNGPGFVIFQTGGTLTSGLDFIECDTMAGGYDALLLEARAFATEWVELCAACQGDEDAHAGDLEGVRS